MIHEQSEGKCGNADEVDSLC